MFDLDQVGCSDKPISEMRFANPIRNYIEAILSDYDELFCECKWHDNSVFCLCMFHGFMLLVKYRMDFLS